MSAHAPAEPLSQAVRTGSRSAHDAAEATPFLVALATGTVSAADYRRYLLRLRAVYAALEPLLRAHRAHPAVAAVWDPALERFAAIEADLGHWSEGEPDVAVSPALTAYLDRIHAAARQPELLVAHHYTRYLGDLAGGQVIARALRTGFGLTEQGLAFYAFAQVPQPVPYRRAYRARLDALALTASQRHQVVEEVRVAFALNTALFDELDEPAADVPVSGAVPAGSR